MRRTLFHRYPKLINLWLPLLGAGIRVKHVAEGMRSIDVEMRLRRTTRTTWGCTLAAASSA